MKAVLLFFLFLSLSSQSFAFAEYSFKSKSDEKRFHNILEETRCVVCQNQNIADSNAPLANDLRQKIYAMVQSQQSDEQIQTYLTARYGDFILLRPRFNPLTWLLWLFPLIGVIVVAFKMRRAITITLNK